MARKNYTDESRRQAVDLYRSTPGATLRGIAADLGISRHTLHDWVDAQTATAGTTGADATAGWPTLTHRLRCRPLSSRSPSAWGG